MKKFCLGKLIAILLGVTLTVSAMGTMPQEVYAADSNIKEEGSIYLFDKDGKYVLSDGNKKNTSNISPIGTLKISGNVKRNGKKGTIDKLNVSNGNLNIAYKFNKNKLSENKNEWHITADGKNSINNTKLSDDIEQGGILIETSLNGKDWIKSGEFTDYFSKKRTDPIYSTTDMQMLNGCYYRIIVAYKQKRVAGERKILFVNADKKETRKIAEVYEFYAVNKKEKKNQVSSPDKEPRQEYDDKTLVVNAGKDTGYSKSDTLTEEDAHYGWSIGTFTVNGYTQTQENTDGSTVYLKNVGDQVTLWFTLNQNINKLNNNENLVINDDTNGFDQNFQTAKTDMGRGSLIIRYTDSQNHKHDPVIYTDYLAACSTTSADTRVVLYEEGDYEVALDYEIKSTPRKVGSVEIVPDYYNYRTVFKFSVHNSNAMFYPFDTVTGSELQNRAITPNGFRIDLANSKDLDIFVTHTKVIENSSGKHVEDSRGTKAAKDGATYTEEGIYTLNVRNTYTGQETSKTIFVGSDRFLMGLSNSGLSVDELDQALSNGYTLKKNGFLKAPSNPDPSIESTVNNAAKNVEIEKKKK